MKSSIKKINGVNTVLVDNKPTETLSFKSFRPQEFNIRDFYGAGIRIFNINCSGIISALKSPYSLFGPVWIGKDKYDFSALDRQIEMFEKFAPDAYFLLNVHLDSPDWYLKENPELPNSFTHLSQVCTSEKWLNDTGNYLEAIIRYAEEKYNDKIVGYFLLGGHTTEWFSDCDFQEANGIKSEAYKKYRGDENARIPARSELEKDEHIGFLDPVKDREIIEYQKFHNKIISDTVLYFASRAQKVLNHNKLVGLFYGYVLELLDERLWNAGHIDIDRVYRSKDIDFLATPSSYQFRDYRDPGAYMLMCDTLERDGKFYFISFDLMTYAVNRVYEEKKKANPNDEFVTALDLLKPMRHNRDDILKTPVEVSNVMRREFMQRMARRSGMWWFDMMGGWFRDGAVMDEIRNLISVSAKLMNVPRTSASEIAVFVSCESLYYVNKMSHLNTELICNQRGALGKLGAPYDIFSLNDITRVDTKKYKLVVFLDAFYLTEKQRKAINALKGENRTLLFMSACDCITDGGFSLAQMEDMLEMRMENIGTDETEIFCGNTVYGYKLPKDYAFSSPDGVCRGVYGNSGKPALIENKKSGYTVIFSGLGNMHEDVLRSAAARAGVHIFTSDSSAVFANSAFVGIYKPFGDFCDLKMKKDGVYEDIFSGKKFETKQGILHIPLKENCVYMFLTGSK